MSYDIKEAGELIIRAGLELINRGLISRTWGNISARLSDSEFLVTPSGRGYESLTPDDLVVVNIKKVTYEGSITPSSESGIHADIYKLKPEVNFVVHTHQPYASAIGTMGENLDNISGYEVSLDAGFESYADILGEVIPCAEYGMSSSEKLRNQVRKCLKKNKDAKVLLLRNHGVVCMGDSYEMAFEQSARLEEVAKSRFELLCGDLITHSDTSVELKFDSARVDDGYIVLENEDGEYRFAKGGALEAGRKEVPRAKRPQAMLYDTVFANPDIHYALHVLSPFISIYSNLMKRKMPCYIDDQAQIIGVDVQMAKVGTSFKKLKGAKTIKKALDGRNAAFLSTGGAIVTGVTEDDARAAAFVLEKAAMAAVLDHNLRTVKPVPKKIAIKEREIYLNKYSFMNKYNVSVEDETKENYEKADIGASLERDNSISEDASKGQDTV